MQPPRREEYCPAELGARCAECLLSAVDRRGISRYGEVRARPVRPQLPPGAAVAVVSEGPGKEEVRTGWAMVGSSSTMVLDPVLATCGVHPQHVARLNVLACQAAGSDVATLLLRWGTLNKQAKDAGLPPIPSPVECCAPRFWAELELAGARNVIALGAVASRFLLGTREKLDDIRGGPREVDTRIGRLKVMPTLQPARVGRQPALLDLFEADISRAFRLFRGRLRWRKPTVVWQPSPGELRGWIRKAQRAPGFIGFATDVETAPKWPRARRDPKTGAEVGRFDPLGDRLRCFCLAYADQAVVVSIRTLGGDLMLTPEVEAECVEIYCELLSDPQVQKLGHNFGYYDALVLRWSYGVEIHGLLDTIILAHLGWPELPRGLGVQGSLHTDATAWKAENQGKVAIHARSDWNLAEYCGIDGVVDYACVPPMVQRVADMGHMDPMPAAAYALVNTPGARLRAELGAGFNEPVADMHLAADMSLVELEHHIQHMCMNMHHIGSWIDPERQAAKEEQIRTRWARGRSECMVLAERLGWEKHHIRQYRSGPRKGQVRDVVGFNPGSGAQVRKLLYDILRIPIPGSLNEDEAQTASGVLSVSDRVLRAMLLAKSTPAMAYPAIQALRRYRLESKKLGTYARPLRRADAVPAPSEEMEEDERLVLAEQEAHGGEAGDFSDLALQAIERLADKPGGGRVWPDGRLRVGWSVHATGVGRLSSNDPVNQQTIPEEFRSIFRAQPGHVLLAADMDQAHLRIIANRWKIPRLLESFHTGVDPHLGMALYWFPEAQVRAGGWSGDRRVKPPKGTPANDMRQCGKVVQFTGAYMGGPPVIWLALLDVENEEGQPIFANIGLPQVRAMYDTWMAREPEWERAWTHVRKQHQAQGYLREPVTGRRHTVSKAKANEVVNWPILAEEAALMHLMGLRLMEAIHYLGLKAGGPGVQPQEPRSATFIGPWGPNTGIIGQIHDQFLLEVPGTVTRDARGKVVSVEGPAREAMGVLQECMTLHFPGDPVPYTCDAHVGEHWGEV